MSLDVKEAMVSDMTEAQRRMGKEPTPTQAEKLVVPLLEKIDQKKRYAIAKPPPRIDKKEKPKGWQPAKTTHKADASVLNPETGEVRKLRNVPEELGYKILHEKDDEDEKVVDSPLAKAGPHTIAFAERLAERISLLLTKRERGPLGQPSWSERVMAILATRHVPTYGKKRRSLELITLCEQSSEVFGDWKKDPKESRPLLFT